MSDPLIGLLVAIGLGAPACVLAGLAATAGNGIEQPQASGEVGSRWLETGS